MANEKRLIDMDVAIERARASDNIVGSSIWETCEVVEFLEDCPIVDAVEVVHGRWEHITDYGGGNCFGYCSNCKTPIKSNNRTALIMDNVYCRYCGAKMDGEGNDGLL